jgi:hypothetical protein
MRLFRQASPGDWETVVRNIARELGRLIKEVTSKTSPVVIPASEARRESL